MTSGTFSWSWAEGGNCKQETTDIFYMEKEKVLANTVKKHFCYECPVRKHCLETAILIPEQHGIWGGLTPRERKLYVQLRQQGASHQTALRKVDNTWLNDTSYKWDDVKDYAYEKAAYLREADTA